MKGERLVWFRLAARLGTTVGELQSRISSSEFTEWQIFFQKELEVDKREHYYLAQIALEVKRSYAKNPGSLHLKGSLIKFTVPGGKTVTAPTMEESKKHWLNIVKLPPQ